LQQTVYAILYASKEQFSETLTGLKVKVFGAISHVKLGNRGDTIVEVLIAIAVLGAALGGAYVTANRNSLTNRASQERLEAVKVAESQLERLKALSSSSETQANLIFNPPATDFCVTQANQTVTASSASCLVDSSGNSGTGSARYQVSIEKGADITTPVGVEGAIFTISVNWSSVRANANEALSYKYEVYR
jgi:Tfp pilus assembly protein PilV